MNCPPAVREIATKVDGVEKCEVDYDSKTVTCTVKKGTDPKMVVKAFADSRFQVAEKN